MHSTIKDIAKDTGLSLGTISKYLNHKKVSEENRKRIDESIRKLHYTPNSAAQALRSKSSHCICIFTPDISDYHFGCEADYMMKAMREKGYSTIIRSYSMVPGTEGADISFLENRQIDGVFLFARVSYPPLLLSYLSKRHIPFICMHQKPGLPADFVSYDDQNSGRLSADYLCSLGHSRILILGMDSYSSSQKVNGFLTVCREKGVDLSDLSIVLFPSLEDFKNFTLPVSSERPPSAVLFLDHFTSLPLLRSFYNNPALLHTLSIMAFDDDEVFSAITPALTVISQNARQIGFHAAELLYRRIMGDTADFPKTVLIPSSLLERESVHSVKKTVLFP